MSTNESKPEKFSAYGWVTELENPFAMDNPDAVIAYLDKAAEPLLFDEDTKVAAAEMLKSVLRAQTCKAEYEAAPSKERFRTALMAMFAVGVSARELEQELHFPQRWRIHALKQELGKRERYIKNIREPAFDQAVDRMTVQELATRYARQKWVEDIEQQIRTSDMTEIVWAWLLEDNYLREHMPSDRNALKKWLRPIAAEFPHANKPGRPGKK